jgi:hypothetical protein
MSSVTDTPIFGTENMMYVYLHTAAYILYYTLYCFVAFYSVNCQFTGSEHSADIICGIPCLDQMSALCQDEADCTVSCSGV